MVDAKNVGTRKRKGSFNETVELSDWMRIPGLIKYTAEVWKKKKNKEK